MLHGLQKAPCAIHLPSDDPNFKTTKEQQEERLRFIAAYTDAATKAKLFGDQASADFIVHDVPNSALVQAAETKPDCFAPESKSPPLLQQLAQQ